MGQNQSRRKRGFAPKFPIQGTGKLLPRIRDGLAPHQATERDQLRILHCRQCRRSAMTLPGLPDAPTGGAPRGERGSSASSQRASASTAPEGLAPARLREYGGRALRGGAADAPASSCAVRPGGRLPCLADRANLKFQAPCPNSLCVSCFTHVPTWQSCKQGSGSVDFEMPITPRYRLPFLWNSRRAP
jgi:hypothetical protein